MKHFVLPRVCDCYPVDWSPHGSNPRATGDDGTGRIVYADDARRFPWRYGAMMGMVQHVEGRIAFLRTELKITDDQSPQWNAFADALRANARRMTEMHGMMGQGASPSAPERLDHMEKMMAGMLEVNPVHQGSAHPSLRCRERRAEEDGRHSPTRSHGDDGTNVKTAGADRRARNVASAADLSTSAVSPR